MIGNRPAGRAKNNLLRRFRGGAARMPPELEKNANILVCIFFYLSAPDHGEGAVPPPLSG
jgi:hypothetical protein